MIRLLDYFLGSIKFDNEFARMKARFLLGLVFFALAFHLIYTLNHAFIVRRGWMFIAGDLAGICGILAALFFLTRNKIFEAGVLLIVGVCCTIFVGNVLGDFLSRQNPVSYARMFISASQLMFLGIVSVLFITKKEVFLFFGILASFIVIFHFIGIQENPKSFAVDKFTPYAYLIGILGMLKSMSGIGYFILYYLEKIEHAHAQSEEKNRQHSLELEATVAAKTRALVQSNEHLREFAYVVSHDLKEPLRTVNGFVSLAKKSLSMNGSSANETEVFLQQALKGTEQMEHLIKDILEFSKLSFFIPEMKTFPMEEAVQTAKERLTKLMMETDAVVESEPLPDVVAEKTLVTQLFQNLISNALKYRSPDRKPFVKIGMKGNEFFVQDNGIGIAHKFHQTIFEPFKRVEKSSGGAEGTGIGLAICKKIVMLHHGNIRVESTPGEGCTFFFSLSA